MKWQANYVRTTSTILALVLFFGALSGAPAPAWAAGLRVERPDLLAEISNQPASPETDLDDSLPIQGVSLDGVPAPAAPLALVTIARLTAERRVTHRAPRLGDADRCRDP